MMKQGQSKGKLGGFAVNMIFVLEEMRRLNSITACAIPLLSGNFRWNGLVSD
jgi:hypothetical protein